eukprot:1967240-Pleurochrysis_carterae.AAC.2
MLTSVCVSGYFSQLCAPGLDCASSQAADDELEKAFRKMEMQFKQDMGIADAIETDAPAEEEAENGA